jgi:hypothetical protein
MSDTGLMIAITIPRVKPAVNARSQSKRGFSKSGARFIRDAATGGAISVMEKTNR